MEHSHRLFTSQKRSKIYPHGDFLMRLKIGCLLLCKKCQSDFNEIEEKKNIILETLGKLNDIFLIPLWYIKLE